MSRNQNSPQSQEILNPVKEADELVTKAEKMAMKESIAVPKKPRTKASEDNLKDEKSKVGERQGVRVAERWVHREQYEPKP